MDNALSRLVYITLLSSNLNAQQLVHTDCPSEIIIENQRWNIFYPGLNFINIAIKDASIDSFDVRVEGYAKVKEYSCNEYEIIARSAPNIDPELADEPACWIIAQHKSTGELYKRKFIVVDYPAPYVRLGEYSSGSIIPAAKFKEQKRLIAWMNYLYTKINGRCEVLDFNIIKFNRNGRISMVKNEGAFFQKKALKFINSAKPGDRFLFCQIKTSCPNSSGRVKMATELMFEISK